MNTDNMKRWVELKDLKAGAAKKVKEYNAEQAKLAPLIMAEMLEEEIPSLHVSGQSLHTKQETYVKVIGEIEMTDEVSGKTYLADGMELLSAALVAHDHGDIVRPGSKDITSLVRSYTKTEEGVPEWLLPFVTITTERKLAATAVAKKTK